MKQFFWGIIFLSFAFNTQAEFTDTTNGAVIYSVIHCLTNETSAKDLQDAMGIYAYHFNVHRSLTNGVSVCIEIKIEGKPTKTFCQCGADFDILNTQQIGEDVPVFVSMNPVGSMDGEDMFSAKKLHFIVKLAGMRQTDKLADNPFFESKEALGSLFIAEKESPTIFKFMENFPGVNSSRPKTEITVRFYER